MLMPMDDLVNPAADARSLARRALEAVGQDSPLDESRQRALDGIFRLLQRQATSGFVHSSQNRGQLQLVPEASADRMEELSNLMARAVEAAGGEAAIAVVENALRSIAHPSDVPVDAEGRRRLIDLLQTMASDRQH